MWQFTGRQRPSFAIEPGPSQESVWDYPRPPSIVRDAREITVRCGEIEIARTSAALRVLETASPPTVYLPPGDVNMVVLSQSMGNSLCEWKGQATYWSVVLGDKQLKNVGWSYDNPTKAFQSIQGYLSFYPAQLACFVGNELVRPQPGGFYGGWVTDEIIGPYKGEPGTRGW